MRIVVTGATGNIGTSVLRRLSQDDHELLGMARRVPEGATSGPPTHSLANHGLANHGLANHGAAANSPAAHGSPAGARPVAWHPVDLTRVTVEELADAFRGADAVVHLAWGFQPSHDLEYLWELGVGGTRRVVEAMAVAGVPHLVHMSSVGAYSPRHDDAPVDESWPADGVPTARYSRHKAEAERILDDVEARGTIPTVTRLRPGIVGQRAAGSALLRYGVPGLVPARALGWLPVLPLDRGLSIPIVHADDVADAVARAVARRAAGAFNLAAEPPLTAADIADALGARLVHVPSEVLRTVVSAGWNLRLQQLDTGWIDLAFAVPLLDTTRARTELGWAPSKDAREVLAEVVEGLRTGASGPTPSLRPRTVPGVLRDALRQGTVAVRARP